MKKHPEKNEIIDYAMFGNESGAGDYIIGHISQCDNCRKKYEQIKKIYKPAENLNINPSNELFNRIEKSYDALKSFNKQPRTLSFKKPLFKKQVLALAASIVIVAAISILVLNKQDRVKPVTLKLGKKNGVVLIGNNTATGNIIKEADIIKTGKNSFAEINFKKLIKIIVSGETTLKIKKSIFNKKTGRYIFSFSLEKGTVYGNFFHGNEKMNYSFKTFNSLISSIGTEFLLTASKQRTELILTKGTVRIKSLVSGEEVKSIEKNKYTVESDIKSDKIGNGDIKQVNIVKNISTAPGNRNKIDADKSGDSNHRLYPENKKYRKKIKGKNVLTIGDKTLDKKIEQKRNDQEFRNSEMRKIKKTFREQRKQKRKMIDTNRRRRGKMN